MHVAHSLVRSHTYVFPSDDSRQAFASYWRKYVQEVLINHLGGLSLPRRSVVSVTDMIIAVYRGLETTQQNHFSWYMYCPTLV